MDPSECQKLNTECSLTKEESSFHVTDKRNLEKADSIGLPVTMRDRIIQGLEGLVLELSTLEENALETDETVS